MAEPVIDSKIVIPLVPTFSHLALVKVAIPLFFKYGSDMLNTTMTNIQLQNLSAFNKGIKKRRMNYNEAHEALLFIPAYLRQTVLEAVNGIECEVQQWRNDHYFLRYEKTKFWEHEKTIRYNNILYWRPDGTIDRIKTAQELVLNKNIRIGIRFKIACMYCLLERIKTLWAEMVASGKTESYETTGDSLENGWIEWICAGTTAHWGQVVLRQFRLTPLYRCSSFFSALQPEDRKKALTFIEWSGLHLDDLRFCLCAMTYEEREEVVRKDVVRFLSLFAQWPLQNFFLETVEKVKNYIDYDSFCNILSLIDLRKFNEDFDYCKLILGFWNTNPNHYKELLKETPQRPLINKLHQCIKENRFPKVLYIGPPKFLRPAFL